MRWQLSMRRLSDSSTNSLLAQPVLGMGGPNHRLEFQPAETAAELFLTACNSWSELSVVLHLFQWCLGGELL